MDLSDNELILRSREGNMQAFEELVHRYDRRVLAIAFRFTGNMEDAQDLYQEVFIRALNGLMSFRFESRFSTWLYRVTANVCLSWRSRRNRHRHVSIEAELKPVDHKSQPDPLIAPDRSEELVMKREMAARLKTALSRLSPRQRAVFTLRHFEGLKLREIAEVLDCTDGTVKKHLFSATEKMRGELSSFFPQGAGT